MVKTDFRARARAHLKATRAYLAVEGESSARSACLALRMAIEALTYQTLQTYLAEVPNAAMAQWTPKRVMDELLAINPKADKSAKVFIGVEETYGVPAKEMRYLGEDKRFTAKWANKAHNALGNFLHEPTIAQHHKAGSDWEAGARAKAIEVLAELRPILASSLFSVNMGVFVTLDCLCGFLIKHKQAVLDEGLPVACASCGRPWNYEFDEAADVYTFGVQRVTYNCLSCQAEQSFEAHEVDKLPTLICDDCGARAQVEQRYHVVEVDTALEGAEAEETT